MILTLEQTQQAREDAHQIVDVMTAETSLSQRALQRRLPGMLHDRLQRSLAYLVKRALIASQKRGGETLYHRDRHPAAIRTALLTTGEHHAMTAADLEACWGLEVPSKWLQVRGVTTHIHVDPP